MSKNSDATVSDKQTEMLLKSVQAKLQESPTLDHKKELYDQLLQALPSLHKGQLLELESLLQQEVTDFTELTEMAEETQKTLIEEAQQDALSTNKEADKVLQNLKNTAEEADKVSADHLLEDYQEDDAS